MQLPDFLLRKLYRRGSLRETADGMFGFQIRNPLGSATLVAPPKIVVNGISYKAEQIESKLPLAEIGHDNTLTFAKGDEVDLRFPGHLMRGGNRIHITLQTREFGELVIFVEDKEADFCDIGEEE